MSVGEFRKDLVNFREVQWNGKVYRYGREVVENGPAEEKVLTQAQERRRAKADSALAELEVPPKGIVPSGRPSDFQPLDDEVRKARVEQLREELGPYLER